MAQWKVQFCYDSQLTSADHCCDVNTQTAQPQQGVVIVFKLLLTYKNEYQIYHLFMGKKLTQCTYWESSQLGAYQLGNMHEASINTPAGDLQGLLNVITLFLDDTIDTAPWICRKHTHQNIDNCQYGTRCLLSTNCCHNICVLIEQTESKPKPNVYT